MVGAGGHGREVVAIALACAAADVRLLGVVDDGKPDVATLEDLGVPLLGSVQWLGAARGSVFIAALGYPEPRRAVVSRAEQLWRPSR